MIDCSTMTIVVPRRWISRTTSRSCATIVGARPSDSSSIISSFGPGHERAAERQHLLLATGQVAGHLARARPEDREQLLHFGARRLDPVWVLPDRPRRQPQVLGHRQRGEHALAAGHQRDAAMRRDVGRQLGDVLVLERDRPTTRPHEAADALEQGGLARTVGAQQGHDLAFGDLEVDAEQDLHRPVGHVDALAGKQAHFAAPTRSRFAVPLVDGSARAPRNRSTSSAA